MYTLKKYTMLLLALTTPENIDHRSYYDFDYIRTIFYDIIICLRFIL